jgi:hypothetical protein
MTDKDQKMLQSALWHISNSVTNGKSQTAECEITQWLKNKINSIPDEKPSEDLEEAANLYATKQGLELKPFARRFFIAGANWQKEQMMKGFCYETRVYQDEEGDGIDTPIESWLALENNEIMNLPNIGLKDGDKVKVIIVKEDEK